MNIHFAAAWLRAFSSAPEDVLTFYADEFDFADPPQERFIRSDKPALARAIRALSNKDPRNGLGIHRFEAVEYIGDQNSGLVLWKWMVKHANTVFGMPAKGNEVQATGMSFHVYQDGKILREIVYSDQIHVAQTLGLWLHTRLDPESQAATPDDPTKRSVRH